MLWNKFGRIINVYEYTPYIHKRLLATAQHFLASFDDILHGISGQNYQSIVSKLISPRKRLTHNCLKQWSPILNIHVFANLGSQTASQSIKMKIGTYFMHCESRANI